MIIFLMICFIGFISIFNRTLPFDLFFTNNAFCPEIILMSDETWFPPSAFNGRSVDNETILILHGKEIVSASGSKDTAIQQ